MIGPSGSSPGIISKINDLVLPLADTVVWLDYAQPLVLGHILRRTLLRCLKGGFCFNGNRESFRTSFLTRNSVILWSLTTHAKKRRECLAFLATTSPKIRVVSDVVRQARRNASYKVLR